MYKPKIILWDIETSYMVAALFGLYNQNIPYQNILEEWFIISIAWKELGKKRVHAVAIEEPGNDYEVIKKVHEVLSNCDAVIHHNGDNFDIKKFNARAIIHGFPPLPKIVQIDTLKMARKVGKFSCNRLDYLGDILGVGRKIENESGLWLKVLRGDKKALKSMVKYNKQDVLLLEAVYDVLKPWVPAQINHNVFMGTDFRCPSCSSPEVTKQGFKVTRTGKMQKYQCQDCGHWFSKPLNKIAR